MSEAVIVALITGGVSLFGTIVTVLVTNRHTLDEMDKKSQVSDAKMETEIRVVKTEISNLRDEVRKHNGHGERITTLEEKAKSADRRLTDLEHKGGAA